MFEKFVFKPLEHMEPFWALERIVASILVLLGCLITLGFVLFKPDAYLASIACGLGFISMSFAIRALTSKVKN